MARDLVRLSYARLVQLAAKRGVPVDYLERDYVLTIVLRRIARTPELGDQLVLKGGLALRHIYGSHRMSVETSSAPSAQVVLAGAWTWTR